MSHLYANETDSFDFDWFTRALEKVAYICIHVYIITHIILCKPTCMYLLLMCMFKTANRIQYNTTHITHSEGCVVKKIALVFSHINQLKKIRNKYRNFNLNPYDYLNWYYHIYVYRVNLITFTLADICMYIPMI